MIVSCDPWYPREALRHEEDRHTQFYKTRKDRGVQHPVTNYQGQCMSTGAGIYEVQLECKRSS